MELGTQTVQDFCASAFLKKENAHEDKFRLILKQMLLGLQELHEKGIELRMYSRRIT
jgi:hypothetical protein